MTATVKATREPKPRQRRPPAGEPDDIELFGPVKLAALAEPVLQGRFRWCPELGWLLHDGAKWAPDSEPEALRAVVEVIRDYTAGILSLRALSREDCVEIGGFSNGSNQNHALKLLRGAPGIRTPYTAFDALPGPGQPWTVPCANGITIELHADGTKATRPTTPEDLNTRTACTYDPEAKAPSIAKAFKDYQPDENVRRYQLQMWCRALSGMGAENFIANIGAGGGNGKGTMWGCLSAAAGGYAAELPVEVILKTSGRSAREAYRSELAALRGCRLLFCEEPYEGAAYDLGMLKKITGGGTLQGRGMGKEYVEFPAKWLFEMAANCRPAWPADDAMTRRYIEIAWNFSIMATAEGVREDFKEALKAEASGFLNAILAHWTGVTKPVMPDVVDQQTRQGSAAASPLADFARDVLVAAPAGKVAASQVFEAYETWVSKQGIKLPLTQTKFGRELPRLGYPKDTNYKGTFYLGFVLDERYETGMFRT